MKDLTNFSVKKYINELAGRTAVPGGGSSSAVVSLNGVALLLMVANFSVGKAKHKKNERTIKNSIKKLQSIKKELEKLVTEDACVYTELMKTLKKKTLKSVKNKAFRKSASVPQKVAKLSEEAFKHCSVLMEKGNPILVTDVACAVNFLKSAYSSAKYNVLINMKYISDGLFTKKKTKMDTTEKQMDKDMKKMLRSIW